MKYIISILFLISVSLKNATLYKTNFGFESQAEIIGTWRTIPLEKESYRPKFEVVISKDSILVSKTHIGGWGYKQLLSYKFSGDTIYAKEIEYMSFDQNIGYIISHFKYRQENVRLLLMHDHDKTKMTIDPLQPGAVLSKTSNDTFVTYNFGEQLTKWRIGNDFKRDYKKNGRPITSAIGNGG